MGDNMDNKTEQSLAQSEDSSAQTVQIVVKDMIMMETARLNHLVDLIGTMVVAEATERHNAKASGNDSRERGMLRSVMRELHEVGMSLRMVPLRPVFQKMARLVRDLSKQTGKSIRIEVSGENTELEKNMVEQLSDPLVQLVRFAVHHGIEASAEERRKANKPEAAVIRLRAIKKGGYVHIELDHDGKEIDQNAILARALEKGHIITGQGLNERDINRLLFLPGVLLDTSVPADSPRQIKLDLVKREIDDLRGQYELTSQSGGPVVFSLLLPLTLTIIDGMILRVGKEHYVIPTLSIILSTRPAQGDISTVLMKGQMLSLHGNLLPLFQLSELFDIANADLPHERWTCPT